MHIPRPTRRGMFYFGDTTMPTNKFKAGETQGTYVLTEPVTTEEILAMANRLARARVTKGKALTSPSLTYSCLQTLLQGYEREMFTNILLNSQHRIFTTTYNCCLKNRNKQFYQPNHGIKRIRRVFYFFPI